MSYDISLIDPVTKETLEMEFQHQMRGGTYAMNGTSEAWLNITYNYSRWYYKDGVFPDGKGVRSLYGTTGLESISILNNAIKTLESMTENLTEKEIAEYKANGVEGYWLPTRQNAIKPLYQLLVFAKARPDGIWEDD